MYNWLSYYGNGYVAQQWTQDQRKQNVDIIAGYFLNKRWTPNAIAAMLGNMQSESYINPGQWQHGYEVEDSSPYDGFGLVQWTPWSKLTDWGGYSVLHDYDKQLDRIQYEVDNGLQWENRNGYNMSFYNFTRSSYNVAYLTQCFFWCYEYGTWDNYRIPNAEYWYEYITGNPPDPPTPAPSPVEKDKFKLLFYLKPNWKRGI